MSFKQLISILAAVSLICSGSAVAQQKPVSLSSDVKLIRLVEDARDGNRPQIELVEPETVVPGDVLAFSISYRNAGGEPVTDFVIVNPVPTNVRLSEDSATESEVSIDGGEHWGMLETLNVTKADGTERPATASDVTHLRWKIALLDPGQSGSARFQAIVR